MHEFGKSQGGGRRRSSRCEAPLLAVLSTVTHDHRAALVNISTTGARLCARGLPPEGDELIFRVETVHAFGRVVWSERNECGVAFDGPIPPGDVERLRKLANMPSLLGLSAEERAALEDWQVGSAN